jgi:DNA-directed RNA polymerase subunit N (RpoN/RPB10)
MRMDAYTAALGTHEDDIDPAILCITEAIQVDLDDVFDQLGIRMICCRKTLLTEIEFKVLY